MSAFLRPFLTALHDALLPLRAGLRDEVSLRLLLNRFGWDARIDPGTVAAIRAGFAVEPLIDAAADVADEFNNPDPDELALLGHLTDALVLIVEHVRDLAGNPPGGLPFPLDQPAFWQDVPPALVEDLLVGYLRRRQPLLFGFMLLTGVIEEERVTPVGPGRVPYIRTRLRWDRLGGLATVPGETILGLYHWADPQLPFDHDRLLRALEQLCLGLGWPVRRELPRQSVVDDYFGGSPPASVRELTVPVLSGTLPNRGGFVELGVRVTPVPRPPAAGAAPSGLMLEPVVIGQASATVPLGPEFTLTLSGGFDTDGAVRVELFPDAANARVSPGQSQLEAGVTLEGSPRDGPWLLLGAPDGHRLEVGGVRVGFLVAGPAADPEVMLEVGTGGGRIVAVVQMTESDGFLGSLLGTEPIIFDFAGGLSWSLKTGFALSGSAGITLVIPLNLELGPVELLSVIVALRAGSGGVELAVGVTGGATIGPVAGSIENVGLRFRLIPRGADERPGAFGSLDFALGFLPPTGFGMVIDAGPVTGGGFLSFDHPNGRYAGILQLSIYSVAVTAIGLLDTKGSDGRPLPAPGFSFLIIISAEFPPIQLGFGFTLNGVGGLAGIHRTLITEALQTGIRTGSVDHILFPEDPIRDAPQIISDLRAIFPPQANRFVFGPMALLGWGSPTLIEGELGIILEVPAPIRLILLGQLNVILPDPDAPVVELHMDVLGILDFGRRLLAIDASLRDSRIAAFTMYGDMAFRLNWGERPGFAFSVGGLNPHFQPPPEFPALRRVTVSLGLEDNPRVSLQSYMAVTSNSIQFGAQAELYAAAGELNVHGWLFFDALATFAPFYFRFDFGLGLALRWVDDIIAGIAVSGRLEGPSPWHLRGEGCISILFFDVCIGFDVTIGEREEVTLLQQEVWSLLAAAINDARNWSATLPPAVYAAVGFKSPPGAGDIVLVHPMGTVTLHQNVVPLDRVLEKYGEFEIIGPDRFLIAGVQVGDEPAGDWERVRAFFAPGQYERLMDAEKLSRDSFEPMVAGLTVGSQHVEHGVPRAAPVAYETQIVDSPWDSRPAAGFRLPAVEAQALGRVGAKARSRLRRSGVTKYAPDVRKPGAFGLQDEEYVIVNTSDLSLEPLFGGGMSKGEAYLALKAHLVANPQDRERLQVVPRHETESAP